MKHISLAVALLVVVAGFAALVGGQDTSTAEIENVNTFVTSASAASSPVILSDRVIDRTPETSGAVQSTITYQLPDNVVSFRMYKPQRPGISVVGVENAADAGEYYEWDESSPPKITLEIDVADNEVPDLENGLGVEGEDWAVVSDWTLRTQWSYRGDAPVFRNQVSLTEDGVVGDNYVYIGAHETRTQRVGGETVLLVSQAGESIPAEQVYSQFELTAGLIKQTGSGDRTVGYDLPDMPQSDGPPGRASNRSFYVAHGSSDINQSNNIWVHEYIHTRQSGTQTAPEMEWIVEASANYYSSVVTLNHGDTSYEDFSQTVESERYESERLTAPSTWSDRSVPYQKGEHVLAALDVRIQEETGGDATLLTVYNRVMDDEDTVTYADFRGELVAVTSEETGEWADRYIDGREMPEYTDNQLYYTLSDRDSDGDRLLNSEERELGTSSFRVDSDRDGLADGKEVTLGLDPTKADTDGDGIPDGYELNNGLDPFTRTDLSRVTSQIK